MTAKQFLTFSSGAPFQPAVADALALPDDYFAELRDDAAGQARPALRRAAPSSASRCTVPQGTYFVTTDIRPLGFDDGVEFCRGLPERCGVVAIPHQVFYDDIEAGRPLGALGVLQARRGHRRGAFQASGRAARSLAARVRPSASFGTRWR